MPTVTYPKNANSDTVFVEDGGKKTRAVKTVQPDGTIDYPTNPNSDSCYVTVDGEKQRALMVADISSAGTIDYPENSNSTKGYVTVNGKKQRVVFTANIAGGGSTPVIDELNVTPSTSAQVITAPTGTDGYSPVNVSAVDASIDANITAGNIKKDVTILGVTGSYEGGGSTPPMYVEYVVNNVGGVQTLQRSASSGDLMSLATASSFPNNILYEAYKGNQALSGKTLDISGASAVGDYAFNSAFYGSNLSGVVFPSGSFSVSQYAFNAAFENSSVTGSISIKTDLSNLDSFRTAFKGSAITSFEYKGIITSNSFAEVCKNCSSLTTVTFGLDTILRGTSGGGYICQSAFENDTAITTADVSGVIEIGKASSWGSSYPLDKMFGGCTGITEQNWASLSKFGKYALRGAYYNCSNLTDIYFPSLYMNLSFDGNTDQFSNMLTGVSDCTVHFPSNYENAGFIETLAGYDPDAPFGATSGAIAYDLPATVMLTDDGGDTYFRNPKFDTEFALAWTQTSDLTTADRANSIFYTDIDNGEPYGNPIVGDGIYEDPDLEEWYSEITDVQDPT